MGYPEGPSAPSSCRASSGGRTVNPPQLPPSRPAPVCPAGGRGRGRRCQGQGQDRAQPPPPWLCRLRLREEHRQARDNEEARLRGRRRWKGQKKKISGIPL
uniref:Uncharacterized protein n=1 Tax=Aegilops tauschii subsp. strangulata TaxID=200361 RepID=A0A453EZT4_AEGTS